MKKFLAKLSKQLLRLNDERGQDLIEYLLLVSFVAFAATVGMKAIAIDINSAFGNIGTTVGTYVNSGHGGGGGHGGFL